MMGTITHLVTRREDPLAVLSLGNPIVEQGSPALGWISLLHRVTSDPVSNKACTLTSPKEISALGRENSGLEVSKQFRAVRHVMSCWGMSRLKAIPCDRFPTTKDYLGTTPVQTHENRCLPRMDHGEGCAGLAREGPKFWRNLPLWVPKGAPCPWPLLAVNGVWGLVHCLLKCPICLQL